MTAVRRAAGGRRTDHGAVTVFVAMLLVLMVPLLALSVDLGRIRMERTHAQGVADNAVLAAAYASCTGATDGEAESQGLDVAVDNGYSGTTVERVAGASNIWQAEIATSVDGLFAPAVSGAATLQTTTAAGAECRTSDSVLPAVFAGDSACGDKSFEWSGSNNNVTGDLHSNDDIKFDGHNNVLGYGTYVGTASDLNKVDWTPSTGNPVQEGTTRPWPKTYAIADWALGGAQTATQYVSTTVPLTSAWFQNNPAGPAANKYLVGNNLKSNVYYTSRTSGAALSGSGLTGTVTFAAANGPINVSGSTMNITAKRDGLLFISNRSAACAQEAADISGSSSTFRGTVYGPRARIKLSGSSHTLIGSVLSRSVSMSGSSWSITADGEGTGSAPATLLLD